MITPMYSRTIKAHELTVDSIIALPDRNVSGLTRAYRVTRIRQSMGKLHITAEQLDERASFGTAVYPDYQFHVL